LTDSNSVQFHLMWLHLIETLFTRPAF